MEKVFGDSTAKILADAHGYTVGKDLACGESNRCQNCLGLEKMNRRCRLLSMTTKDADEGESTRRGRRAEESGGEQMMARLASNA